MQPGKSSRRRAAWARSLAALALACALAPAAVSAAGSRPSDGDLSPRLAELAKRTATGNAAFLPGEAIVRFEPDTSSSDRSDARHDADVELDSAIGLPRAQLVKVEGSVSAAIRRLERQPGVDYAQPNYIYSADAVEPPDDTFFGQLWGLSDPALPEPGVGVLDAWGGSKGAGRVIAVLDTGVDLTHPDIEGNLWTNESPGPDGDLHGYDFVDSDGDPDDYNFHGTHVAGTAAAISENTLGIAGVAPEAQIMAVRVLDGDGSGSTADIAEGIAYAANHEADVINMSLGGPAGSGDEAMADAIEAAANVVVVVAAGNEEADNDVEPHSPCVLPQANLICVAALNQSGSLAGFSNFGGESVDLAAPGTSTLSAKTDYGPALFSDAFDSGIEAWTTEASDGGVPWGTSSAASSPPLSATDSPAGEYGHAPDSVKTATSELFTDTAVDLTGERGCRIHFNSMYQVESFFDAFLAGAISEAAPFDVAVFDGESPGYPSILLREEASVSKLDGRSDVHPIFAMFSDETVQLDGAYVDDVRLFCRDNTYVDTEATSSNYDQPASGNYVRFNGTSMATPHVAGVVALVRAAAPSLNALEVVDAVLKGTSAIPSITVGKRTVTEGIADACKAMAVATGGNVEAECPASSEPTPQPAGEDGAVSVSIPVEPVGETPTPGATPRSSTRRAPNTFFRLHPRRILWARAATAKTTFRFGSNEAGVTFLCKFDRATFRLCRRRTVWHPELGRHVLRVKARDRDGDTDPTPAVFRFRVLPAG